MKEEFKVPEKGIFLETVEITIDGKTERTERLVEKEYKDVLKK